MKEQIKLFLEPGAFYPDDNGKRHKLDELIAVDPDIIQTIGKETLENILNKKIVSASIKCQISSKIGNTLDIYEVLHRKKLFESLRNEPEKLCKLYCQISKLNSYRIDGRQGRDTLLARLPFILGEDKEIYQPAQSVLFEIDMSTIPIFLKEAAPKNKKLVHPKIAKDAEAVKQLERCGIKVVGKQSLAADLEKLIANIAVPKECPQSWRYPDDLIESTLFLISQLDTSSVSIKNLVATDEILHAVQNLFVPHTPLDWTPLWRAELLPGFQSVCEKYFDKNLLSHYGITDEHIFTFLSNIGVHGFDPQKDKGLIEKAAVEIAKKKLRAEGHIISSTENRDRLGYDLQCQGHCGKVFEIKGMTEPHDIILPESEVNAARQKRDDYILICVYNLPADLERVGYKEIPNPEHIWQPTERARISKDKWFGIIFPP